MKPRDVSKLLLQYENKWVALSRTEDRVIAYADTLQAAKESALDRGETNPVMFKVPSSSTACLLSVYGL